MALSAVVTLLPLGAATAATPLVTPSISVAPTTGLVSGQALTVTGTGFPTGFVAITECRADAVGPEDCDIGLASTVFVGAALSTTFPAARTLSIAGDPVDCAAAVGACTLVVSDLDFTTIHGQVPLGFDPNGPAAAPELTVTPASGLLDRQVVTLDGRGFLPNRRVFVEECSFDRPGCRPSAAAFVDTDGTGAFSEPFQVSLLAAGELGVLTNCVVQPCFLRATDDGNPDFRAFAPLEFDPDQPLPPVPALTVTPSAGLHHEQLVEVAGSGFAAGQEIHLSECPPDLVGDCDDPLGDVVADEHGAFTTHVHASRLVTQYDDAIKAPRLVDCVVGGCAISPGSDAFQAAVLIGFDPTDPPPTLPHVTITPVDDLPARALVLVDGTGFEPGAHVTSLFCAYGTEIGGCDFEPERGAVADASGTVSFVQAVRRIGTRQDPGQPLRTVDCVDPGVQCFVRIIGARSYEQFRFPITFDPSSVEPPPVVPELEVHGVSVAEGTGGVTTAPVRVELSDPAPAPVTLHWITDLGTATAGADYTPTLGTLTIPSGATEAVIPAGVVADALDEPTERFTVRVLDAPGARIEDGTATVKIRDDDAAPTVVVHDARRREDHGEAHAEVLLSAPSGKTVIVHYVTHHRTARAGSDYVRKDSRLIFRPGQVRHVVRVVLVDDGVHESTETFRVELDRIEEATASRDTATVTITDDD